MNTSASSIKALNDRRLDAVRRRLDGESLADVSVAVGLSVPTVVAAMKAYEAGGWDGVAVKPRGRPAAGAALSADRLDDLRSQLIQNALDLANPAAKDSLWNTARLHQWLADQGVDVSPATANRHARSWGIAPVSPAPADKPQAGSEIHQFIQDARKHKRRLIWLSSHSVLSGNKDLDLLCAHTARGLCLWQLIERIEQNTFIDFLNAVSEHVDATLAPVLPLNSTLDSDWMRFWEQQTGNSALLIQAPASPANNLPTTSTARQTMTALNVTPAANSDTLLSPERLTHLQRLEAESIHIMREVVAEAENPVMLYSVGKDSAVMLHLAVKAFYPAPPPFPLLHVDTTWKFQEMYKFRDTIAKDLGFELLVHHNEEGIRQGVSPFTHGSELHTDILKTQGLKQALDKYGFDVAFGGARRDEEKSRAKERVFSFRTSAHRWEPKSQRPELWNLYNAKKRKDESIRVFPISNWTELDVWQYIHQQSIPIVPLYFAGERPVVERDGQLIMVDDDRMPLNEGETPEMKRVRFRTLGCYPLTGAVESEASTLPEIIQEMLLATTSERQGRLIDHDTSASMEKKKQEGYF